MAGRCPAPMLLHGTVNGQVLTHQADSAVEAEGRLLSLPTSWICKTVIQLVIASRLPRPRVKCLNQPLQVGTPALEASALLVRYDSAGIAWPPKGVAPFFFSVLPVSLWFTGEGRTLAVGGCYEADTRRVSLRDGPQCHPV